MNANPILIIDDDLDDLDLMKQAFRELEVKNEIIAFTNGLMFLTFMAETPTKPFFILCDMNLNSINGLELKRRISADERLRLKCIPFLIYSTSRAAPSIIEAYSYNVLCNR